MQKAEISTGAVQSTLIAAMAVWGVNVPAVKFLPYACIWRGLCCIAIRRGVDALASLWIHCRDVRHLLGNAVLRHVSAHLYVIRKSLS